MNGNLLVIPHDLLDVLEHSERVVARFREACYDANYSQVASGSAWLGELARR